MTTNSSVDVAALVQYKRRQAAAQARHKQNQTELAAKYEASVEAVANALDGLDVVGAATQCDTAEGQAAVASRLIAAAAIPLPNGEPLSYSFRIWPQDGEWWPIANEIMQTAENGDRDKLRRLLSDLADFTRDDQNLIWLNVAQLLGVDPIPGVAMLLGADPVPEQLTTPAKLPAADSNHPSDANENRMADCLSPTDKAVLSLIKGKKGKGISGKKICTELGKKGTTLAESTLRRHVLPKLMNGHGVMNSRARGGYYIEP